MVSNGMNPFFALLIIKFNDMEEQTKCECPECERRELEEKEHEEMSMAVLVALVPMLVLTLFTQIGVL